MSYLIRSVEEKDVKDVMGLASQFALLNLPPNEDVIYEKIERSIASFAGSKKKKQDAEYVFVIEDIDRQCIVGSSLVLAKHGTPESPHSFFQVRKEDRFSQDLGVGFIHQVLRLGQLTDGPTEIGGLLIDRNYRRRPEKLGKQISLVRFLYIGLHPERFEKRLLCEFAPPLTRDGRSEFWEALGRRFTGLSYQEADQISQKHKEFISSLFPPQDLYTCLLDTRARQVMGQVSESTRPAQHLLEGLGFQYLNEIDPFDGGPHFSVETRDVPLVKSVTSARVATETSGSFARQALVCIERDKKFLAVQTAYDLSSDSIVLPENAKQILKVKTGDTVHFTSLDYKPLKERGN